MSVQAAPPKIEIELQTMAVENIGQLPEEGLNDADVLIQNVEQEQKRAQDPQVESIWDIPEHHNREPVEFKQDYGPAQPGNYNSGRQR